MGVVLSRDVRKLRHKILILKFLLFFIFLK